MSETIQLSEALGYVFRDQRWPGKAGILAVVSFVPILNFAGVGFELETARRVAVGEEIPMPDWSDLGGLFRRGLWLALARLIYALPLFAMTAGIALAGIGFLYTVDSRYDAWSPLFALLCAGGVVLMVLFGFMLSVFSPAIAVRYLEAGTFASCFHLRAIWLNVRRHPSAHLAVYGSILVFSLGLSLVVGPGAGILSIIPCLGTIAYLFVLAAMTSAVFLFTAHLEGQLLRIVLSAAPPA